MPTVQSIRSFPVPEPTPDISIEFSPHKEPFLFVAGEYTFEPEEAYYAPVGKPVTFTASVTFATDDRYAVGYRWDFGDGEQGSTNPVTHTYTQANASMQLSFVVIDNEGKEWYATKTMYFTSAILTVKGASALQATSSQTIVGEVGEIPVNTVAPVISGGPFWESTFSCTTGTWENSPESYSYQWQINGEDIEGETFSTVEGQIEWSWGELSCVVTATNAYGSAEAESNSIVVEEGA